LKAQANQWRFVPERVSTLRAWHHTIFIIYLLNSSMETRLTLEMLPQPNDFTCGPTCLQAVYSYYGETVSLEEVIGNVRFLEDGGTLAVLLGIDALSKGYKATIYTYNLQVFDPTWFHLRKKQMRIKLKKQAEVKDDSKLSIATRGYLEFLKKGGKIRHRVLNAGLIRKYLKKNIPVLTGLNATYLYSCMRERDEADRSVYDDIGGYSCGHFVVLCGYDRKSRMALVADPLHTNPAFNSPYYEVKLDRLINAILLGIVTYDANLLIIQKPEES